MSARDNEGDEGFTLLEVLVALAILSVAFAVLLGIFAQSLSQARALREREAARALAQSLMSAQTALGSPAPGAVSGRSGDMAWTIDTEPYGDQKARAARLASISVSVRWDNGQRTLTLTSLTTLPKARAQ